jgi:hypothetical protein
MLKVFCALSLLALIASCSRDIDAPTPLAEPVLKRTVQRDTAGRIVKVSYYNEQGLVTIDTAFGGSSLPIAAINTNTYNSRGKRIRWENFLPILYTSGFYWALQDHYQDDTIPTVTYRYFKGNQVARITHSYNALRQLVLDSTWHTPNYGTFTYLTRYTYDANGRLSSSLDLNDNRDTTSYITYLYSANRVEKYILKIDYAVGTRGNGLVVTEYSASGKILSEKNYSVQPQQLYSQVDYTYDAADRLLKKTSIQNGVVTQEDRYYYSSTTGKAEKMEYYAGNQLRYVTTYYYE